MLFNVTEELAAATSLSSHSVLVGRKIGVDSPDL